MKVLIIQPHSDDAILSCSKFIFDKDFSAKVLTVEYNEVRLKEDENLYNFIKVKQISLKTKTKCESYTDFFNEFGKSAVLSDENVIPFYEKRIGKKNIEKLRNELLSKVNRYMDFGYMILCPMGVGHPYHYFVRYLLRTIEDNFIFYREFPHSYKRKAKEQFENEMSNMELLCENSDAEINSIKYKIAQKFYKTQSGFFFYEQGNIQKLYPEEFYVKVSKKKHIQIYVISKDRPNGKTFDILNKGGIPYTAVVEPQDEAKYKDFGHKNVLVLPDNDRGVSYVVNFTKNLYDGFNPLIIMDDDILDFCYNLDGIPRLGPTLTKHDDIARFFEELNDEICNTDFDIGTLGKSAFDWNNEHPVTKIAYPGSKTNYSGVVVVTIINNPKLLEFDLDEELCIKGDVDYSLKCMYLGLKYAKFIRYVQHTKMNKDGKQKGGLSETYKQSDRIEKAHKILLERWPDNVSVDEKKLKIQGVTELKIKYKVSENTPSVIKELKKKVNF